MSSIFTRLKSGFKKTSDKLSALFTGNHISDELWDELEEQLIMADVGSETTSKLLDAVKQERANLKDPAALLQALKREAAKLFPPAAEPSGTAPIVMLVIGVNGAGKTTTIAKIAKMQQDAGKKVVLGAADTFRAAAIDQLRTWGERLNIPVISQQEGSDPASVAYDTVISGISKNADVVIVDTAGRLHTKHNLMEELKKINRVVTKAKADAPELRADAIDVLLVLDGTIGQNALAQAKAFNEAIKITALAITKLDGTAKGGIVLRIASELGIPVRYVGLGERAEDLIPFDVGAYVEAIFAE
ncbi:MAG: signal recognition particle-docking protein FtsY [Deferribacteraceae bacterium]|jgi:fused signal recognition particle receptor|nr:signal recognition particle-docking protein FtsY [Deferribacteraceae bacterium]